MKKAFKTPTLVEEIVFRAVKSMQDEKAAQLAYCKQMNLPSDSISDEIKELERKIKICGELLAEL